MQTAGLEQIALEAMLANPSCSQVTLAAKLSISRGKVRRIIAELKKQKLVRSTMGKWVLTATGKAAPEVVKKG